MTRIDSRIIAAAWFLCASLPASGARAATYYVNRASSTCSNSGPGTQDRPFCSISAAMTNGGPGVKIIVAAGTYREKVSVSASGAQGSPFVFRAEGAVILEGADDFSDEARWSQVKGDVWRAASVDWTPLQVFADSVRLQPTAADPSELPPHSFTWVAGEGLYVNTGPENPGKHSILVGRRNHGFSLYGRSWVTIEGFTIIHTEDRGINVAGTCMNISILRNTVRFANKMGIQINGGSGMRIASNVVSDTNDHGISLIAGVTASVIEDNESYRNARPSERAANGIYLFGSPGDTLRGNRLHDNQDTGMHFQSGSNNCVCYLNRSWNNGDHGYDHLEATGTIHICDIAYGNYKDGFSMEGHSPGTRIFHSIAVNNGLNSNEFDLWVDKISSEGFVSEHNLFWNSATQEPVKYIATMYNSVAAYSAASGQDRQTLQTDPRFANPASGDFRLLKGSPVAGAAHAAGPGWPAGDAGCTRADVQPALDEALRHPFVPASPPDPTHP